MRAFHTGSRAPAARDVNRPSRGDRRRRPVSPSRALVPLTAVCGVLVASVMAFGNPVLWVTSEQHLAASQDEGAGGGQLRHADQAPGEADSEAQLSCLGSYKAISQDDDDDRAVNIALAADALDGMEIRPGETLSVNEALGDTSQDERYLMAPIVSGATLEEGRGGGICQVSTALYIAAVKANLEIVERHPHTIVVDYAPIGLDATLSYGQLDLRIRNNGDASVFVHADALGQTVDVGIYGIAPAEPVEIDATSKIVDRAEIPAEVAYADPEACGLARGDSITYYTAEAYRATYRDGVMESCELMSTDRYQVSVQSRVSIGEGGVDPAK